jgi:hypothetical protein
MIYDVVHHLLKCDLMKQMVCKSRKSLSVRGVSSLQKRRRRTNAFRPCTDGLTTLTDQSVTRQNRHQAQSASCSGDDFGGLAVSVVSYPYRALFRPYIVLHRILEHVSALLTPVIMEASWTATFRC